MITDKLVTFAEGVAAGNTGTRIVGDVVDIKSLGADTNAGGDAGGSRDVGAGQPVYLEVSVDEAFAFSGTDFSYTVKLVSSDDSSDMTSAVVHMVSSDPNTSTIAIGTVLLSAALPAEGASAYKQYIGIQEVVVGTTTTGKINAHLTLDPRTVPTKVYPDNDAGF